MSAIRTWAAWAAAGSLWIFAARGQPETGVFLFEANTYSAGILDLPRANLKSRCPELCRPPAIGDAFAYCVYQGSNTVRKITGTVVSSNILECAAGPEISLRDTDLRIDLLRSLYLTDALQRTPQTNLDDKPVPPPPPEYQVISPP